MLGHGFTLPYVRMYARSYSPCPPSQKQNRCFLNFPKKPFNSRIIKHLRFLLCDGGEVAPKQNTVFFFNAFYYNANSLVGKPLKLLFFQKKRF
ncbi:MAG: hypothetical protein A2007_01350 [Verrucomicrobia bacterium GWC2_42_7]|nr:MAG: hypothetical protein A2007_01350 [Verrucomicrobia bacterium GWC2_42_7]